MRVYISGAITGTDDWFERFYQKQIELIRSGYDVVNPTLFAIHLPHDCDYEDCMHIDFALIDICDAIYMMKGWRKSRGATRECQYALQKGKRIIYE